MLEEKTDTLSVVGASASLGKLFTVRPGTLLSMTCLATYSWTDVNGLDAVAELLFVLVRHSIGDNDLL